MKDFFGDGLLLNTPSAEALYQSVKDLPIVDYHCHLNENELRNNHRFADLGELWLAADHYKWRAMRLCGVDEKYITGDASFYEKYLKYAEIFPLLCGGPLYYWTQLELKLLFGIQEPLCAESAERIWNRANEILKTLDAGEILRRFKVEYVATTDDPASALAAHGICGNTNVRPTFRPDFVLNMDEAAIERLEGAVGKKIATLAEVKVALEERLNYFISKGCKIADHGMDFLPLADPGEARAAELFAKRGELTLAEKQEVFSHLMYFMAALYAKNGMVMQLHFATFRNVNSAMFATCGRDAGFDIMRGTVDTDRLITFFDTLAQQSALPKTVLYSLNPACVPALATLSGAFPGVRIGAAWWFSDTVEGIRRQLETVAEYAVLGTNLGMLTDSRSLASYVRFDFFRRILADFVGGYVERGEYDLESAKKLMYGVCYGNVKAFLNL
jgi:glucuronate isomerase